MKFIGFKEYKNLNFKSLDDVVNYLSIDLVKNLRELAMGLNFLKFTDNFNAFKITMTIPASSEIAIRNELSKKIPTERIIVRSTSSEIVDGDTPWDLNYVYLKNTGASAATVTVIFLE